MHLSQLPLCLNTTGKRYLYHHETGFSYQNILGQSRFVAVHPDLKFEHVEVKIVDSTQ